MSEWISDLDEIAAWRDELDGRGQHLVFTNGCFDLLHAGHVRYLRQARALGDALVVAINSDESVRQLKGAGRPVHGEEDRAEILRTLEPVDRVVVFREPRATACLRRIRPHIYAKGGDYRLETLQPEEQAVLREIGAETRVLTRVEGRSTSHTLAALRGERTGPVRLAVLGSGKGSNFEAIADAIHAGRLDARIQLVLSDVPEAPILQKARERGIPTLHVAPGRKGFRLTGAASKEYADRLRAAEVELVALAGFMRLVEGELLEAYRDRILNIHPSLLPAYPGKEAWKQALEAGESEAGCSVHVVTAKIDAGPVLGRARLEIRPGETPESLHRRIQELEHELFPGIIGEYAARLRAEDGDAGERA